MSFRDYVNDFFDHPSLNNKKKISVDHNKWDKGDYEKILKEMKRLRVSRDNVIDVSKETGGAMIEDTFLSLMKAVPKIIDAAEMKPSHLINHMVMKKLTELNEHEALREYSVADSVAAGLACVSIEEDLVGLLDQTKQEMKKLQDLENMMQEFSESDLTDEELEQMMQDMMDLADELDQDVDVDGMVSAMRSSLKDAAEDAQDLSDAMSSWGLDQGQLAKMPIEQRLKYAEKFSTKNLKELSKLFGQMERFALSEQSRKVNKIPEEVVSVELGNDLSRILPSELIQLVDEDYEMLFYRKFAERGLMQYKMQGTEKVAKGNIICCEDGSGSMSGAPAVYAKAVSLALMKIAVKQNRHFFHIHFGGPGQYCTFDFEKGTVEFVHNSTQETYNQMEGVIKFAETSFNASGTCFKTPLDVAMARCLKEYEDTGQITNDIVFITDGQAGVTKEWLDQFKADQLKTGTRVWGILIGGWGGIQEPLKTICDNRVVQLPDLLSKEPIGEIFRGI